jgi:asparagine synthase (glutamine-hydrolysing)
LLDSLRNALLNAVRLNVQEHKVGIAFSGGVDSTLLARICSILGKSVVLITVGFPGSHDIDFSNRIATMLGLPQRITEIDATDFRIKISHIRSLINCDNTSHIENCLAYHYVAKSAKLEELSVVLSANGCDELFCGYDNYRLAYENGYQAIDALMEQKIANECILVKEIATTAGEFGIAVRQPFLDPDFVAFAKTIPIYYKIRGSGDMLRKHVLREVALELGVPQESAMKPKKALQYGSLIHKNFVIAQKELQGNSH